MSSSRNSTAVMLRQGLQHARLLFQYLTGNIKLAFERRAVFNKLQPVMELDQGELLTDLQTHAGPDVLRKLDADRIALLLNRCLRHCRPPPRTLKAGHAIDTTCRNGSAMPRPEPLQKRFAGERRR